MQRIRNERGSVLVFVTLMMVLLFVMVGMGLDTGQLTYVRSQGQPAVDAAALAAVNALPTLDINEVHQRAAVLNYNSTSKTGNNYLDSKNNTIGASNVSLLTYSYDANGDMIFTNAASIASANAVRVALESTNPYDNTAKATPMKSPVFLTPLLNLLGQSTKGTQNVSVSAVAVLTAIPGMPIAIAGCDPADNTCKNCQPTSASCDAGGDGSPGNPYRNCKLLQVNSSNNGNGQTVDTPRFQDSGWT
ncbi:MAG TPA: pilus assembly protein TadG-related protein, partial [Candidatus Saccharimonadales bacterium]|nr:pilus assembly protein TadG-related protein [Candidatus Saccharimonadales bacterium]